MKRAEALLPGTDALPTATVEVANYRGKTLVRFRDRAGITTRQTFTDPNEAMRHFWKCADQLQTERRTYVPTG
jgi:hypothetical protein